MQLTIKRFSPELKADFFDFFDNRAFGDNSPYYPCYCDVYYLTPKDVRNGTSKRAAELGGGKEGLRLALRESAERLINSGIMQGYLAYDGNLAVGWCNAGDKSKYTRAGDLNPAHRSKDDLYFENIVPNETFCTICFEVAPEYRGKGIAKAMLLRALKDAETEGYKYFEGYPKAKDGFSALDFTGPMGLYLSAGFSEVSRTGKTVVMRKEL